MTAQELISAALRKIGITDPDEQNITDGLADLNDVLATFAWWDDSVQPIYEITLLSDTINLPPYYLVALQDRLTSEVSTQYGLPLDRVMWLKKQADESMGELKNKREIYRPMQPNCTVV